MFATPEFVRGRGGYANAAATWSWTKVLEASGLIFQIVSEAIRTNRTITAYEEEVRIVSCRLFTLSFQRRAPLRKRSHLLLPEKRTTKSKSPGGTRRGVRPVSPDDINFSRRARVRAEFPYYG
ncbi:MAG: hypothetical protein DME32_11765 [Verrucomicrobia bacterium]|nr:MAG: hypothetical protein DME32_11765 [Verrucomicrobiota bacterium]